MIIRLESRLADFQTDSMLIMMYDFDRKDWHVMTHHEMNPPSRNQESKAALIGMTFVLVFPGREREREFGYDSQQEYANSC